MIRMQVLSFLLLLLAHVRAGEEVFTQEIIEAGFKLVGAKKVVLKESYFVRFEKAGE